MFLFLLNLQLVFFMILAAGYVLRKRGCADDRTGAVLSELLIMLILPCNIVSSFFTGMSWETVRDCALIFVIFLFIQTGAWFLGKQIYGKTDPRRQAVLRYSILVSNCGLIGLPFIQAVYGSQGLLYASIALLPVRISMWTAGLSLFTATDSRTAWRRLLFHPCVAAVYIGMAAACLPFALPSFLTRSVTLIGSCTAVFSMLTVGIILGRLDGRKILKKSCSADMIRFSLLRLILIPAAVIFILKLLEAPEMVINVSALMTAMPAGSTAAVLSQQYGGDREFASETVFVTTFLSILSIPLISLLLRS
mgnify:CR=1 FL=1